MKYLKLVRWPNLLILLITMLLVQYMVVIPRLAQADVAPANELLLFTFYAAATLLIAAGGYVVNDMTDIDIDRINKPEKMLVTKSITMTTSEKIYFTLTFLGSALGISLGAIIGNWMFGLLFPVIALGLWLYSKRYKRMLLIGNLLIALITALVIALLWLTTFFALTKDPDKFTAALAVMPEITGFVMAYALFAFLTTILREVIKDIEDMEGDAACGCRTFAVVYGMQPAKNLAVALLTTLLVMIGFWQYILYAQHYTQAFIFLFLAIAVGILLMLRLAFAHLTLHYAQASFLTKLLMLAGLLSLFFVSPHA